MKILFNIDVVFFGGYAISLFMNYLPKKDRKKFKNIPYFDILSKNPHKTALYIKDKLTEKGFKNINVDKKSGIEEIISYHYEVKYGPDTLIYVYQPLSCHSYNVIEMENGKKIKVATIDTILSFYLTFVYLNKPYYNENRLLCIAEFLFKIQQHNRLSQKGLLKRFDVSKCYGKEKTMEDIKKLKADKYIELKNKKNSKEYEKWFLKYTPKNYFKKDSYTTNSNSNSSYTSPLTSAHSTYSSRTKVKKNKTLKKKNTDNLFQFFGNLY